MLEQCRLCPRECGVNRRGGQLGFCGAGEEIKIARAALHFWEEPCISGSQGSGTVFFSCCTMKCVYCQNYPISTLNQGKAVTVEELADRFLDLQKQGAHNINLVTPTHFVPQIIEALKLAKSKGLTLPVVYNCGGYEKVETLKLLEGYVDIYMPDMKYYADRYAVKYSSAPDYFAVTTAAIKEMVGQVGKPVFDKNGIMQKGVIVRHMMIPGLLFDSKKILDYLYDTYHNDIYISMMSQYTPMPQVKGDKRLSQKLNKEHYEAMIAYCEEKGIENAFIQEGEAADESFIPPFENE